MISLVFVTRSADKIREAESILGFKLESHTLDLPEIQSVEVEQVVAVKAEYAYNAIGKKAVMVEDTGLYIEAWDGLPGALVKWFLERTGPVGICKMLHQFPNRKAWAETIVATYDGEIHLFRGKVKGSIATEPRGDKGFGWDSIFIPDTSQMTFSEMSLQEKNRFSMRRLAFEDMKAHYSNT